MESCAEVTGPASWRGRAVQSRVRCGQDSVTIARFRAERVEGQRPRPSDDARRLRIGERERSLTDVARRLRPARVPSGTIRARNRQRRVRFEAAAGRNQRYGSLLRHRRCAWEAGGCPPG